MASAVAVSHRYCCTTRGGGAYGSQQIRIRVQLRFLLLKAEAHYGASSGADASMAVPHTSDGDRRARTGATREMRMMSSFIASLASTSSLTLSGSSPANEHRNDDYRDDDRVDDCCDRNGGELRKQKKTRGAGSALKVNCACPCSCA